MSIRSVSAANFGFGCSGLMGRLNLRESVRLLEAAFDAGITYFDVARSYGYGAAERAVGAFARNKRDRISIATKFGLLPPRHSLAMNMAKKAAGAIVKLQPGLRARLRARASGMVSRGVFSVDAARASFETSLRELQVERVEVLMLHQCSAVHLQDGPLRELLEGWLVNGRIGRIGIASDQSTIDWALHHRPFADAVYQFPNSLYAPYRTAQLTGERVVTHSTLREDLPRTLQRLQQDAQFAREWQQAGFGTGKDDVAAVLLAWALHQHSNAKVLFSSSRPNAIGTNVQRALSIADQRQNWNELERFASGVHRGELALRELGDGEQQR